VSNRVDPDKYIKNVSIIDLFHTDTGTAFKTASYTIIDKNILYRLNDNQLKQWFDNEDIIYAEADDGSKDYLNKYEGWHKLFDYCFGIPFLSGTNSTRVNSFVSINAQEAIEESKGVSIDNDLDTLQFGRQGTTSNSSYLLTLNNMSSNDSPDTIPYPILFRRMSLSVSNFPSPFTLAIWKASYDHSVRTIIYTEEFSIVNGNFSGHAGYTQTEQSILVGAGEGIYVQAVSVGNPKPSNLSVFLWTRKY